MAGSADEWAALGCGGAVAAGSGGSGGGDDAGGGGPAGVDAAEAAVLAVPAERKNRWVSSCLSGALLIPPAPTTASPRGGGSGGGGGGGGRGGCRAVGGNCVLPRFSPLPQTGAATPRSPFSRFSPLAHNYCQPRPRSGARAAWRCQNSDLERGAGRSLGWQMDLQQTEREGTGSDA